MKFIEIKDALINTENIVSIEIGKSSLPTLIIYLNQMCQQNCSYKKIVARYDDYDELKSDYNRIKNILIN